MARSHIAVALGAAVFALLVILQLTSTLRIPELDFWHWTVQEQGNGIPQMHLFNEKDAAEDAATNAVTAEGSQYLLGVGKADITG